MPNEPGMTLGRLIAAERNAMAGLDLAKKHEAERFELLDRIARLEQTLIGMAAQITALQVKAAMARGTGATQV